MASRFGKGFGGASVRCLPHVHAGTSKRSDDDTEILLIFDCPAYCNAQDAFWFRNESERRPNPAYFSRYSTLSNVSTICSAIDTCAVSPPAAALLSLASTCCHVSRARVSFGR